MGFQTGSNDSETGGFGFTLSNANVGLTGRADPASPDQAEAVPGGAGGCGVFGFTTIRNAAGVFGVNDSPSIPNQPDKGRGVQGNGKEAGVAGFSDQGTGVLAQSNQGSGLVATSADGQGLTVFSTNDIALYAKGGKSAGVFEGDVSVSGTLNVARDINVTGDLYLANRDLAERFEVESASQCEPGTLMVIGDNGALLPCTSAYDKRAIGVISGAGTLKPAITLGQWEGSIRTAAIALVGTVFCRADADQASINVGDLLTSSTTPGHAMKAVDSQRSFGAVIGKALAPLHRGRGLLAMVIALQ